MEKHSGVPVSLALHLLVNEDDRASSMLGKNDIQRFLLNRLMVLEAALQRVEELRRIAADEPTHSLAMPRKNSSKGLKNGGQ